MPSRFGAASISRRAKPFSKSVAIPKPVNTPPNALACSSTKTNWNAVYPDGKSKPGTLPMFDRPPANATKKNSGKIRLGSSSCGFFKKRRVLRVATAEATSAKRLIRPPTGS